ncbi:hypothetical protein Tco_0011505 [Tanacetum coccineum]
MSGARVDVRTYLLGGVINGSKANGIIRNPKLELESSRFTFDLVPLSSWRKRTKEDTRSRRSTKEDELRLCDIFVVSCKERVGSNGNLLWEASVLLGRKKGGVRVAREDDRGVTEGREDVREVFQQRGSGAKRKLSRCRRNQMGNEPILALHEEADDFIVLMKDCMTNVMLYRGVGRSEAKNEFEIDVRRSDLEMESGSYWLDKVWTSIWRDVRTLAIEEAYTTKYSIHPGADTMLCGFRLTNRWLSMKKDIASCGSKYLAYLEVEVEYQGSSGLLLQPEWGLSFEYGCALFEAWYGLNVVTVLWAVTGESELNGDIWLWVVEGLTLERCSTFGKTFLFDELRRSLVKLFVKLLLESFGKLSKACCGYVYWIVGTFRPVVLRYDMFDIVDPNMQNEVWRCS